MSSGSVRTAAPQLEDIKRQVLSVMTIDDRSLYGEESAHGAVTALVARLSLGDW